MRRLGTLSMPWIVMAVLPLLGVSPASADDAGDVRARLEQWAADFNAGKNAAACDLFSKQLISDVRGQGEADYAKRCELINKAIDSKERKFHYDLEIKEIVPGQDLVVVRLVWKLRILPADVSIVETGMDVFRKEDDGAWRIIRYIAYEGT